MQYPPSGQDWPSQEQPSYGNGQPSQLLPTNPQWGSQAPSQPLPPNTQWGQQPYPPQQGQGQQPYGQPPPQQYPPMYQPPQQPKKKSKLPIIIGVVVALVVFACIGATALSSRGGSPATTTVPATTTTSTSNNTSSPQAQPTVAPTQASQTNTIGKPIQVGDTWEVTLNAVSTSKGDEINVPKSGNTFLVVNVTLKNNSSSNHTAPSLIMFSLKDSSGQTYDESITFGGTPDGAVAAGGVIRGNVYYEVPLSLHDYTLQFTPDLTTANLTVWNVKI